MRVGLIAYNWEADTSLALWNIELYARQHPLIAAQVEFLQYCSPTPKSMGEEEQKLFEILRWIRDSELDLVGFSCYVWNIKFVNRIAKAVRTLWPAIKIVYGGQQIKGFYIPHLYEHEHCVDICVDNEAEISFQQLLLHFLTSDPELADIPGIAYQEADGTVKITGQAKVVDELDDMPSPYLGDVPLPLGGAFLYEASRGCPYRCAFCIWGESDGVREYDMERVEAELNHILAHQPSHIMFCDGTFNMRQERATKILSILVEHLRDGRVEPFSLLLEQKLELVRGELVDVMDELVRLNPLVTLEFGLQSSSQKAAKLMRRPFSENRFRRVWSQLTPKLKSMAILDCIYGLPGDGVEEFKQTVDFAYSLTPHKIQCFRLAILPGSEFERQAIEFDIKFSKDPDHMVYQTPWVGLDEMMWLELFGFAVADLYHFHGTTIKCLLGAGDHFPSFSALISDFVDRAGQKGILDCLYGNNRPEGRWRAIDLSQIFVAHVLDRLLPEMGISDPEIRRRFEALMVYECALGDVAVRGMELQRRLAGTPAEASEHLSSYARILDSAFDIPSFVVACRDQSQVDISELVEKPTAIAISQKAGHQGVKIPISYRISSRAAELLNKFEAGYSVDQAVSDLSATGGSSAAWRHAINNLKGSGLLVSNLVS